MARRLDPRASLRVGRALLFAACVLLSPAPARAGVPWARTSSPEQEAERLSETRAGLDPALHARLAASVAKGTLIAAGDCVSSGTVERGPDAARGWVGEVESVATITVSNLSERWVWAVELSISGQEEGGDGAVWRANLPFLPPHSEAEIVIGCAQVPTHEGGGPALNELRTTGRAEVLDARLAALLVAEPTRYRHTGPGQVLAWGADASTSLAIEALLQLDDAERARVLLRALLRPSSRAAPVDSEQLLTWFEQAPGGAALVLAEQLLADDPQAPALLLERGLARGRADLEPALRLALSAACERADVEQRRALYREHLSAPLPSRDSSWKRQLFELCPLEAQALAELGRELIAERRAVAPGRPPTSPALAAAFEYAPLEQLEILRASLSAPAPELPLALARLGVQLAADKRAADKRAAALESMLASPTQRIATLEQLSLYAPSPQRLARFERISASLGPADAPTLASMLASAAARPDLPLAWIERLFELVALDPARLRPILVGALARRQLVFSHEALAKLDRSPPALAKLFATDPCLTTATFDSLDSLARCVALFETDAEIAMLARSPGGLTPAFIHTATLLLREAEPSEALAAQALALSRHGLSPEPIVAASCARAEALDAAGLDSTQELAFLRALAPAQACVQTLEQRYQRERLARGLLVGSTALVLLLLALAWRRRSRG